ncbi:guanylate kinase [Aestuariispira insulae]|uniref:Guanylate kinase n=1 Tax=Aestuariispira insulae TaxID=1461337 RepID=A0A3D9HVH7_9PROT|nr:guanylate kinase [Aestuariispira insulae]RED53524.1 guanylate kinase [Aestuariispira insulae]
MSGDKVDPFNIKRRGLMLVLSSPSGAGKSTIAREILATDPNITLSVSATTRPKRPGEVAGLDYHFVDTSEFNLMVNRGEMLEHAKVFDNYYGTPRKPVMDALAGGRDVLFDIDWQGTQQLAEEAKDDLVRIFILPPSTKELEERLKRRAQDPADVVAKRMAKAADEMSHYPEYDWVIVNNDVNESVHQVRSILTSERLRRSRQLGLGEFVKHLRDGQ